MGGRDVYKRLYTHLDDEWNDAMNNRPTHIDERLLVLYLLDEISQQGRARVEAWLAASEANREYFASFEKTWKASGSLLPDSVRYDAERAWQKLEERMGEGVTEVKGVKNGKSGKSGKSGKNVKNGKKVKIGDRGEKLRVFYTAAAVLLLVVASAVFVRIMQNRQGGGFTTLASSAEVVKDTLSDGSSIVLNTHSELKVPVKFAGRERRVELKGEAFFEVRHIEEKPFVIDAGMAQVRVLGTSFHVKAFEGQDLEVFVESGKVELSIADPATGDTVKRVLKAGERGMIRRGTREITTPAAIGADELFWAGKKLIFEETKLSLVFDLLRKHYNAVIELKDTAIRECRLSAIFTDEPIEQILEVITASFGLGMERDKDTYIITGKGCSNEEK